MNTKALRQKILDLAIHGKLVPQDPNDEPASVLLERIRAEKERLIKEGKIKRPKKTKTTSDKPHYPYLLPEGWVWCKLEDIATFGGGKTPSMDVKEYWNKGKNLWVTSKDMKNDSIHDSLMKITDEALNIMTQYEKDTLLVVTRSGILRHTLPIAILEKNATINQDIKSIMPLNGIIPKFLFYAIKANENIILTEYHKDGTTVDSIDFDKFKCLPIPLPPINEQKRIITEVLKVSASIDCIDCGKADLYTAIAQAKSKILNLAIHGKLVPQDPTDEPASELLKRINPKAEITCDNGHYQKLPEGWCMTNIGSLFDAVSAKRVLKSEWKDKGVPFYRAREIVQLSKEGFADKDLFISEKHYAEIKDKYGIPTYGDIMISAVGSIGYTYIVKEDDVFYYKDASVLCLKNTRHWNSEFFSIWLASPFLQEQMYKNSKGTTVDTITLEKIKKYAIPFPPLNEQNRIVSKIEEIFAQLDAIEASL